MSIHLPRNNLQHNHDEYLIIIMINIPNIKSYCVIVGHVIDILKTIWEQTWFSVMLCWLQGLDVTLRTLSHCESGYLNILMFGIILKVACQFYHKCSITFKQFVECTSNVSQLKNGRGSTSSETFQETSPLSSKTNSVLQQYRTAQLHMPIHVVFITVHIISFNANKHVHVTYMSFQGRISHKNGLK